MPALLRRLAALLMTGLFAAACAGSGPSNTPPNPPAGTGANPPAATATTAPAAPGPNEFQNPVLRSNFPDPFLLKVGDTWYAYATNGSGKNIQMATSKDLVSWTVEADAMPTLAGWTTRATGDVWAPEVMEIGGKYVMYYTARDKASKKQCVGVAVSDKPEGKFKDTHDKPLVCQSKEGGTIDPDPFQDGDKLYLMFKNDGNCCGIATYLYSQELAADGQSLMGEPTRLIRNDQPWEGSVVEAPTMFKHEGKYYLFFSGNSYAGPEYAVGYATCEGPKGPCTQAAENPILKSRMDKKPIVVGPGHQALVQVGDQTWIVYHAWQISSAGTRTNNRQMWIDQLNWQDGKPVVAGPTTDPQSKP